MANLVKWLEDLGDSSGRCFLCERPSRCFLCFPCTGFLNRYQELRGSSNWKHHSLYFAAPYGGEYKVKLRALKFKKATHFLQGFAYLMVRSFLSHQPKIPDLLVPVPMGKVKERQRGFNQSELLAREISGLLGLPISRELHKKDTRPLSLARGQDREGILKGSMNWSGIAGDCSTHILLVDDVFTTGATMRESMETLEKAGYSNVDFLALARQESKEWLDVWFSPYGRR